MRLSALLAALPPVPELRLPDTDPVIRGVCYDSRAVAPGDLFFAIRGESSDGHDYLEQAVERGAAALLVEEASETPDLQGRPVVVVPDTRSALAPVACCFYGEPANELTLIGITGTNGKTSVTYLVESILTRADRRVGLIGTVEIRFPGERQRSLNTTPESLDLQRALRAMRTQGVEAVAMEVSSHGIQLGRIAGCRFAVAAVTNLSQDHLDFHTTMEAYLAAKTQLFRAHLAPGGTAVINVDDDASDAFLDAAREADARIIRVSRNPDTGSDVTLRRADVRMDGSEVALQLPGGPVDVALPLVGDFNIENLLVAAGVAVALDVPPAAITGGIAACPQVPGRVERIAGTDPDAPTVLVDYAHTPDAIDKLLSTLKPLTRGRLVSVFGCGGDRARGKRPLMAAAAARWSDRIVATSDNPRTEKPERILSDVEDGLQDRKRVALDELYATENAYAIAVDRREAIRAAITQYNRDDTVVIAGKGHEDYQIIGRDRLPFSDPEEARKALLARTDR
ncbi:MAG: UDP-N-acetylmuramoyl-L-alanyl-D-glutamate--2,6-diaminopimelate ligase [Myxococcota bacterium]|nr:UDP-N-acetylmuramoyl-L-alanyl-D-glutamate--2,6-diaminopimelate ligase [Myxococcota bacterium]